MKNAFLQNGYFRFHIFAAVVFLAFAGIFARLFWLQVVSAEKLEKMSEEQLETDIRRNNPRGRIVDRDGEEMAVSIMTSSLYVDPQEMVDSAESRKQGQQRDERRISVDLLAPVLKMDAEELYGMFLTEGRFLWVKRTMDPKEADIVRQVVRENRLPGLHFIEESKRYYTKKRTAAQILGFVGTDDVGLSGIELLEDHVLRGAETRHSRLLDALGRQLPGSDKDAQQQNCSTVYLTIDSRIQYVLEEAMDNAIVHTSSRGAAAIIMDPYTGEIFGMASRPTFDPNSFGDYPPESWNNKGISMIYEPGSVIKPLVGCMGLTEGLITPNTLFQDNGSIRVADRVINNWDKKRNGLVPFSTVIKDSINTCMVQLGLELGAQRMIYYSKKFGLGLPTGIDLPGEENGILYNPDEMYEPDVATMAIGQGIAVTPIQVLQAICAIANGGELLQPYIVKKVVASNGNIISEGGRKVVRRVISEDVAAQMREMMKMVVAEGGGRTAAIKGYRIAGKTGTAEKLAEQGGYAEGEYISSFVGFVPVEKPRYVMIVMLDTPQGAFYGSQVSAPVFRDTLQQVLAAKGVQPSDGEDLPSFDKIELPEKGEIPEARLPQMEPLQAGKVRIPDFTGLDMRQTAEVLQQGHLRLKPNGSGYAKRQNPPPGSELPEGATVEIWFE